MFVVMVSSPQDTLKLFFNRIISIFQDNAESKVQFTCTITVTLSDETNQTFREIKDYKLVPRESFKDTIKSRNTIPALSDSMTCMFQYYPKEDSYLCPYADNGVDVDVYRLLSNEGGMCVFDRKCNNDVQNYQACGCSFMSVGESIKLSETSSKTNYMEVSTRICISFLNRVITLNNIQSDPDLVPPDLVTPRFSDRINFPRYRKLTVFDPDLVPTPI
eukprot:sb/3469935/